MASLTDYLKDVRGRAEVCLSSTGSAPDVQSIVQEMANIPLPLLAKYRLLNVAELLRENCAGPDRKESIASLLRALSILEKYGFNLANPKRPKYWRTVKHNNPIFRTTVDAIKGGRVALHLYGYTIQQSDGLSFPDDVTDPDIEKVAAVTVEIMALHTELELFIKDTHQHPEFLERILTGQQGAASAQEKPALVREDPASSEKQQLESKTKPCKPPVPPKPTEKPGTTPALPTPAAHTGVVCSLCGSSPSFCCPSCKSQFFCEKCDEIFHRHPDRTNHTRDKILALKPDNCPICGTCPALAYCPKCTQGLCLECDERYHTHPDRKDHHRIQTGGGTPLNPISIPEPDATCKRARLSSAAPAVLEESSQPVSIAEWQCQSCTVMNSGSSVLCSVCERPRLATRPPAAPQQLSSPVCETSQIPGKQWTCQACTYVNSAPSTDCEVCDSPRSGAAGSAARLPTPSPVRDFVPPPVHPVAPPRQDLDLTRQRVMKEEGLKLIQHIREGDKKGVSPEEVYAAICVSRGSNVNPCDWLKSELPHLLDEICAMAASLQQDYKTGDSGPLGELRGPADPAVQLSRAEAKQAWVAAGGDTEKAVKHLLRSRRAKVRELRSLGFVEEAACEEALRLSGGDLQGALALLQRPLMEAFHQRVWSKEPPARIDPHHPDKQWLCRRLLALYDLPSWGRCELVLSLLQEPEVQYSLEDVLQVVRESSDRDFIKRTLNNECPVCTESFPKNKMEPLTACECSVCCDCFRMHFTIAVRDKHIRDMVCPVCGEPDINDHERLEVYFSVLDAQLRDCLEKEVYELFHKKLTEHALMKDPNFRWCTHCSFGFIYDGIQLKVQCPQCDESFCSKCRKPWEPQHTGLTCEQFQTWKRENDPEYQRQGLVGYLRDNGITCPGCKFQYALSKGGCMHFSCSQCRYQFCSGCNNPYHKTACEGCAMTGLHAHHPRDCLFYMRDWEPERLQALLQMNAVAFNIDPPNGAVAGECGVMEQKEDGDRQVDSACGLKAEPGQAGLCQKHYGEYLVSLINGHSIDPATLFDGKEVLVACRRYGVDVPQGEAEEEEAYIARLKEKLMSDVPLGDKVPRMK
ncbi:E3 ubiquitin-protein ligase RNF31-like isoform X2 [Anguilla anguilla]|uniref:E3 ubiquitin-protein ligase RNF31-like isoform X2 n=1 Tax=Anguilla anguilla TaxID=7936 RepID=UPI0015AF9D47|nr:E3 ubiquitin-protein ligase RNF31-like isoform X2 [Anguilla anguilla]